MTAGSREERAARTGEERQGPGIEIGAGIGRGNVDWRVPENSGQQGTGDRDRRVPGRGSTDRGLGTARSRRGISSTDRGQRPGEDRAALPVPRSRVQGWGRTVSGWRRGDAHSEVPGRRQPLSLGVPVPAGLAHLLPAPIKPVRLRRQGHGYRRHRRTAPGLRAPPALRPGATPRPAPAGGAGCGERPLAERG